RRDDQRHHVAWAAHRRERDVEAAPWKRGAEGVGDVHREPGLAGPARTGQRDQPDIRALEESRDLGERPSAPDEFAALERREPRRRRLALGARVRVAGGPGQRESLGEHEREVVLDQLLQLRGVGKRAIGDPVLLLDPTDEPAEALLARVGPLDVDELRHVPGKRVLVLEARDGLTWRDPTVALPVDAEEHVALGEVRAIEIARRMRARAHLEHDRGEAHALDRVFRRGALLGKLLERGTYEDAHTLIRRTDGLCHRAARPRAVKGWGGSPRLRGGPDRRKRLQELRL